MVTQHRVPIREAWEGIIFKIHTSAVDPGLLNGGGAQTILRRKAAAPGDPHTVRCPVSAKIRRRPPISAKTRGHVLPPLNLPLHVFIMYSWKYSTDFTWHKPVTAPITRSSNDTALIVAYTMLDAIVLETIHLCHCTSFLKCPPEKYPGGKILDFVQNDILKSHL